MEGQSILALILTIAVLGTAYWAVGHPSVTFIAAPFKVLLKIVIIVVTIVIVGYAFGVWQALDRIRTPAL